MKIITALDNFEMAEELAKEENIELICMDISYKEGIIEQLEQSKKADLLIFDEKIDGEIPTNDLIRQIKERARAIEIIIISQNKEETQKQIGRFKKIQIYETNKIKIKKMLPLIFPPEETEPISEPTSGIAHKSEAILDPVYYPTPQSESISETTPKLEPEKSFESEKEKQFTYRPSQFQKLIEEVEEKSHPNYQINQIQNLVTISGPASSGKTTIAILIAKFLASANNKRKNHLNIRNMPNTLLVDFNLPEYQDISTIFEIEHPNTLTAIDSHIQTIATKKYLKIKMLLKEYDFQNIIVDFGNYTDETEKQKILQISKTNIIMVDPSIIGIKRTSQLIDYYINKLGINPKTIKIVINKQDKASVDVSIIKKLLNKKIIGEVKFDSTYNALVNNGFKNISFILNKNEKLEIKKIAKRA